MKVVRLFSTNHETCAQYDQKVQKARRNAGQLSVQGQMGHTDLSPGSPPPLSPLPNDAAGHRPSLVSLSRAKAFLCSSFMQILWISFISDAVKSNSMLLLVPNDRVEAIIFTCLPIHCKKASRADSQFAEPHLNLLNWGLEEKVFWC